MSETSEFSTWTYFLLLHKMLQELEQQITPPIPRYFGFYVTSERGTVHNFRQSLDISENEILIIERSVNEGS